MNLLILLTSLCWCSDSQPYKKGFCKIKEDYLKENKNLEEYFNYFEKNWIPLYENGKINYYDCDELYRSNSIIENFHRNVTQKLPKKPNWPEFMEFLKFEENIFVDKCIEYELLGKKQQKKSKNFGKKFIPYLKTTDMEQEKPQTDSPDSPINFKVKVKNNISKIIPKKIDNLTSMKWIEWKGSSCRYDSLLTVFLLGLYKDLSAFNTDNQNENETIILMKKLKEMMELSDIQEIMDDFVLRVKLYTSLNCKTCQSNFLTIENETINSYPELLVIILDFMIIYDPKKKLNVIRQMKDFIFNDKIKIKNECYNLRGTINLPSLNHFNASVLDPCITEILKKKGWAFHDGLRDGGKVVKLRKI